MAAGPKTTVTVTFDSSVNRPQCQKKWVHCFWNRPGEEDIRWTFGGFEEKIKKVTVYALPFVPEKYSQGVPGFLPELPFGQVKEEKSTSGSHLPDLVTEGSLKKKGYFCYALAFYDEHGVQLFALDPGGTSDPDPPESQHP